MGRERRVHYMIRHTLNDEKCFKGNVSVILVYTRIYYPITVYQFMIYKFEAHHSSLGRT